MSVKFFVGLASAGSAVVIAVSLLMVCMLFNDINSLYDEVLDEMDEFKYIANEAWKGMMEIQTGPVNGNTASAQLASLFGRHKRQYDAGVSGGNAAAGGGQCNCAARAEKCPKGPTGAPGQPGAPGDDGQPGTPGQPGLSGPSQIEKHEGGCIK